MRGRWPEEKGCGTSCLVEGRIAARCSTSAVPATGGRLTAVMAAARKSKCNNGGRPPGNTRKAGKDGSITGTGNGPTGNGAASGA